MKRPLSHLVPALALVLLAAVVYGLGWGNALVFDDDRLIDGTVYGGYGGIWPLKQRLLSYGSFVWLDALAPGFLPLQRLFNLVLHLATAWVVYRLMRDRKSTRLNSSH